MNGAAYNGNGPVRRSPVILVDSYARGISIGCAERADGGMELRLDGESSGSVRLRSRYVMKDGEPLTDLERHLERLAKRGELRSATVVFGVTADPFHPFDEKFATSMKFLEMFERYRPGRLVVQTRSPLIVIGLPILQKLGRILSVSIGIETPLDEIRLRYTPHLPGIEERWKTVRALRRFGLRVGVQVAPILPYGDWRSDAQSFARRLITDADYIVVRSFAQAARGGRAQCVTSRALARDRQFFWLRHDAHVPLTTVLSELAEDKLIHPAEVQVVSPQIPLFA